MLDKVQLNNQITALKKVVLKARLHIIQKLVRRIKNVEINNGDTKRSKRSVNIEALKKEIIVLKKLPFRELVKNCLLLNRLPKVILSDVNETTENRCIARLVEHKQLQEKLKLLKEMFMLDQEEHLKGLRSMGSRQKKKNKNKTDKKPEANKHKMEWIEEPNDENAVGTTENAVVSESETKTKTVITQPDKKKNKEPGKNNSKHKRPGPKVSQPAVEFSSESEDDETETPIKTVDSFFITSAGTKYEAITAKNISNDNEDDDVPRKKYYMNKDDELAHLDERHFEETSFEQNEYSRNINHFSSKRRDNEKQQMFRNSQQFNQVSYTDDTKEDLHPSLKVKKQQKIIQPFQGTKIIFESDNSSHKNNEKLSDTADLHPSWAAKIKTKPIITEFTGKKIKFDDD